MGDAGFPDSLAVSHTLPGNWMYSGVWPQDGAKIRIAMRGPFYLKEE